MNERDDARKAESERILARIAREETPSVLSRATSGIRQHVTAKDGEAEDNIDRLGTRIGRAIGLILTVGLVIWLVIFLIRGG